MKRTALFSVFALVLLWVGWVIAYFCIDNEYVLPSFGETLTQLWALLQTEAFWRAFGNTLLRTLLSFIISVFTGILLAIPAYLWKWVRAFLAPIVSVLRTVPTMAIILALLIWTTPIVAPVVVTVLMVFPVCYAQALSALDEVGEEYAVLAQAFRIPLSRRIFKMYLPASAPAFLSQMGANLSMGLKIMVSAEVLAFTFQSLGGMMQEAKLYVQMPQLLALTLVSVITGFLMEGLCALLVKICVRWKK